MQLCNAYKQMFYELHCTVDFYPSYWTNSLLVICFYPFHPESENTAVSLSALLASLNSCCNPWIYMIFSGHLLHDFTLCFPCCNKLRYKFKKEDSDSSLRRNTVLTKMTNRSPMCSSGTWKDSDNSP